MAYVGGKPFASLSNVGLALKMSATLRSALLKIPGARPLQYEPTSPPSKTYVVVPDNMLEDVELLSTWVEQSMAWVLCR